jgi:hypothetical protein
VAAVAACVCNRQSSRPPPGRDSDEVFLKFAPECPAAHVDTCVELSYSEVQTLLQL